jgi:hypothetical protein
MTILWLIIWLLSAGPAVATHGSGARWATALGVCVLIDAGRIVRSSVT